MYELFRHSTILRTNTAQIVFLPNACEVNEPCLWKLSYFSKIRRGKTTKNVSIPGFSLIILSVSKLFRVFRWCFQNMVRFLLGHHTIYRVLVIRVSTNITSQLEMVLVDIKFFQLTRMDKIKKYRVGKSLKGFHWICVIYSIHRNIAYHWSGKSSMEDWKSCYYITWRQSEHIIYKQKYTIHEFYTSCVWSGQIVSQYHISGVIHTLIHWSSIQFFWIYSINKLYSLTSQYLTRVILE